MGKNSVPAWPPPWDYHPDRVLAWYDADAETLTTETGEHWPDVRELATILNLAFEHNLLIFTPDVGAAGFALEAIGSSECEVVANRANGISCIRAKRGRNARWIVRTLAWGTDATGAAFLAELRALFTHCDCGVFPTPSSLGQALMRSKYAGPRISRPGLAKWDLLHSNLVGGRVDTPRLGEEIAEAWEIDQNNAYASAISGPVPIGTACWHIGEPEDWMTCGFWRATAVAPVETPTLGPLPVRMPDGGLAYPRDGRAPFDGWWWTDEINIARSLGYYVEVWEGAYWTQATDGFGPWAEHMAGLREGAPDKATRDHIKACIVGAIGRFGMSIRAMVLTTEDSDTAEKYCDPEPENGGLCNPFFLETIDRDGADLQAHIYSWVMMRCRVQLLLSAMVEGTHLIATNYDSFITSKRPTLERIGWKIRRLTNVVVPRPRWLVSTEKLRRPGLLQKE